MRKLSISNIAWNANEDEEMYAFLQGVGFAGVEIAPTRIFPSTPYEHLKDALSYKQKLQESYSLCVSSMQSIWYGRTENLFASKEEQEALLQYTKQAILFAEAIGSHNLVFGCPRNRKIDETWTLDAIAPFLQEVGDMAVAHHTVFAIEPIPETYHTRFINNTQEAFGICKELDHDGIKVNVDLGTFLYQQEDFSLLAQNTSLINHIHISEPGLEGIKKRRVHTMLKQLDYSDFYSIEMLNPGSLSMVKETVNYIAGELL